MKRIIDTVNRGESLRSRRRLSQFRRSRPDLLAEWQPVGAVVMHPPERETLFGVLHPEGALFDFAFSPDVANAQHANFISLLGEAGASVKIVREVLVNMCPIDELRRLAAEALRYDVIVSSDATDRDVEELESRQRAYRSAVLHQLNAPSLVDVILLRPTVKLVPSTINTNYRSKFSVDPLMNLYFCRDQQITTSGGIVIGRMNSLQRRNETEVLRTVLPLLVGEKQIIYEVEEPGRLEGGDFLASGNVCFIGQGLRTNAEGIRQVLEARVFGGAQFICVVKDSYQNQEQMHLDTFFNIASDRVAVLVETRLRRSEKREDGSNVEIEPQEEMRLLVDIYELDQGENEEENRYVLRLTDFDFQELLTDVLGFQIVPCPAQDQLDYGVNFLTVANGKILAVDGVSELYKRRLEEAGIEATWMDFSALKGGFGAAHCTTQVISRSRTVGDDLGVLVSTSTSPSIDVVF